MYGQRCPRRAPAARRARGAAAGAACLAATALLAAPSLAAAPAAGQAAVLAGAVGRGGPAGQPRGIAAAAAAIADERTGRRLWARHPDRTLPVASLTKVMTAYVVLTRGRIGRYVTITRADVRYVGCCIASAGLRAGDVLTARQLLYAMLLPSGADAARALAEAYGPGIAAFVARMNAAARRLHLTGTRFTNFDGVPASDESTPASLLRLGEAAMRLPFFRAVVRARWHRLRAGRLHHAYLWRNRNLLLGRYPGAIGIKTGWTPAAGECLLFAAVRGHRELIGVVLDSAPTDSGETFVAAARLLDWAFGARQPAARPAMPAHGPLD